MHACAYTFAPIHAHGSRLGRKTTLVGRAFLFYRTNTVETRDQALVVPTQTHNSDLVSSPQVSLNPLLRPATIVAPVKKPLLPLFLCVCIEDCLKICVHVCT